MPKAYKAMDLCMLHLCAKRRLNSPHFQRRSNEKEIRCTSIQQGNAWYWCLPGAAFYHVQQRFLVKAACCNE